MPGFDGTGPMGLGPLTGRGMGFCIVKLPDSKDGPDWQDEAVTHLNGKEVSTMPLGDGTGPLGFGPMTGRGAGFCAGYGVPGYMNPIPAAAAWPGGAYPAGVSSYGYVGLAGRRWPFSGFPHRAAYGPVWGQPFMRGFGRGRGFGMGFGRGRGFGRGFGRGRWW